MIEIEQAKRLKEAGFPQHENRSGDGGTYKFADILYYSPSERQLMDWLISKCIHFVDVKFNRGLEMHMIKDALISNVTTIYFDNIHQPIAQDIDFTEALVQAVEYVLKNERK